MKHFSTNIKKFHTSWIFLTALAAMPAVALAQKTTLYAGSDTVHPVVDAALSSFARGNPTYKPNATSLGTSVGIKDLCSGLTVIAGASRLIKSDESKVCAAANIQFTEIPVALDALTLVVSTKNTWLKDLTMAEITQAFDPASAGKIVSWKQIRPSFPDTPLRTAGVGIKHGTFESFSKSVGLNGYIRSDYKDFKDHTETAKFVAGDVAALGFMPIGEAKAMESQVRGVSIDFGAGPVNPVAEEVAAGKYDKLSRTVYMYVNTAALAKSSAEDIAFAKIMFKDMDKFVRFANLVPLRALQYQENFKRLETAGR